MAGIKKWRVKYNITRTAIRLQGDIAFSNKELENRQCQEGVGVTNKTNNPQIDTTPSPLQLYQGCYFFLRRIIRLKSRNIKGRRH